jgi:hypothetical protein
MLYTRLPASKGTMLDSIDLLLTATDDTSLQAAVALAGGAEQAIRKLFDTAYRLQVSGAMREEIRALVDASNRVAMLALRSQ